MSRVHYHSPESSFDNEAQRNLVVSPIGVISRLYHMAYDVWDRLYNKIDTDFTMEQLEYDPRTWVVSGQKSEIRIRLLETGPLKQCGHEKCQNLGLLHCRQVYVCTCKRYCYYSSICFHIKQLGKPNAALLERYSYRLKDMHLEILMNGGAAKDTSDTFDYKNYFIEKRNFDMTVGEENRSRYWKGYEAVLARHHYGIDLILRRSGEKRAGKVIKFAENRNGQISEYFVAFAKKFRPCECSAFELCTTCRMCRHLVFCSCEDYSYGFFCRHCHAAVMMMSCLKRRPYCFRKLHDYYSSEIKRFFYMNLFTRVRHNVGINLKTTYFKDSSIVLVEDEENGYRVIYEVCVKSKVTCRCSSMKKCWVCQICRHNFSCPCKDFEAGFLCTHAHAAFITVGEIKIDSFDEENRSIDDVSDFDDGEITTEEILHPRTWWGTISQVELQYLAYKPLLFDSMLSEERSTRKFVRNIHERDIRMVCSSYELKYGDRFCNFTELQKDEIVFGEYINYYRRVGVNDKDKMRKRSKISRIPRLLSPPENNSTSNPEILVQAEVHATSFPTKITTMSHPMMRN